MASTPPHDTNPGQDVKSGQEFEILVRILKNLSERINTIADNVLVEPEGAEQPAAGGREAKAAWQAVWDKFANKSGNELTILNLLGNSFKKGGIVAWMANEDNRARVKALFKPSEAEYLAKWDEIEGLDFEALARKYLEARPGSAVSPQQQETLQRLYDGIEASVKSAMVKSKDDALKMFRRSEVAPRAGNLTFLDSLRLIPKLVRDSIQENLKVSVRSSLTSQDFSIGDEFDKLNKNISPGMKRIEGNIRALPNVKDNKDTDTKAIKDLKLALITFVSASGSDGKDIIQETWEQCARYVDKPDIPEGALREIDNRVISLKKTLEENLKKFRDIEEGAETDPVVKNTAKGLSERAAKVILKLDNRHNIIENILKGRAEPNRPPAAPAPAADAKTAHDAKAQQDGSSAASAHTATASATATAAPMVRKPRIVFLISENRFVEDASGHPIELTTAFKNLIVTGLNREVDFTVSNLPAFIRDMANPSLPNNARTFDACFLILGFVSDDLSRGLKVQSIENEEERRLDVAKTTKMWTKVFGETQGLNPDNCFTLLVQLQRSVFIPEIGVADLSDNNRTIHKSHVFQFPVYSGGLQINGRPASSFSVETRILVASDNVSTINTLVKETHAVLPERPGQMLNNFGFKRGEQQLTLVPATIPETAAATSAAPTAGGADADIKTPADRPWTPAQAAAAPAPASSAKGQPHAAKPITPAADASALRNDSRATAPATATASAAESSADAKDKSDPDGAAKDSNGKKPGAKK